MNFKIKKISKTKEKPQKPKEEAKITHSTLEELQIKHTGKKFKISLSLTASLLIILLLVIGIVKAMSSIDLKIFLKVAGDDLKKDAYEHTNFLILGTGGKNHDGGDLTDTILVASLDQNDKLVTMISIPRDFFIKEKTLGNSKINEIYYNAKKYYNNSAEGLEKMKEEVEKMMGIPIHYWVKIDFDGFKELVDALGGIDVEVKKAIYDPYYPKDGTYLYETFSINPGQHHLDGETALKYARSRKTTSDFDRADRQQQIIYAIKEKALSTQTILSQDKIGKILEALKANIETNIGVKEFLTLGSLAGDYSADKIFHRLIHDDPGKCGGFLYTPAKEFYNGMYVLIPADKINLVHKYADLNFNHPNIATQNTRIQILNGTKRGGVAGETKQILRRFCFDIVRFGNAATKDIQTTTYYYPQKLDEEGENIDSRPEALDFLQKLIPGQESTQIPQKYLDAGYFQEADIIIEIGADYTTSEKYIEDPFYYLPAAVTPATTSTSTSSTTTTSPAIPSTTPATSNTSSPTPQ